MQCPEAYTKGLCLKTKARGLNLFKGLGPQIHYYVLKNPKSIK